MNSRSLQIVLALISAILTGCGTVPVQRSAPVADGAFVPRATHDTAPASASPVVSQVPAGLTLARQLNEAFVAVADQVTPSVVIIQVTEKPKYSRGRGRSRPQEGEGSGIIVSEDGYILTNEHVVDNAATNGIIVELQDGKRFPGQIVGADTKSDIAVVKIDAKGAKLTPARLGDSRKLRVGEFVVAIGHPLDLTFSVTVGHVSALQRMVPHDDSESEVEVPDYIQTDAVINPGNSGGPLINLDGEVVGVNDMIEAYTDRLNGETVNVGIGLAIPVNVAKEVKDILIARGKFVRSRIGIEMGSTLDPADFMSPSLKPVANRPAGIRVEDILRSGPASKSNLRIGDLIVAVDDTPVHTPRELYHEISFKNPGQIIDLSVVRGDKTVSVKIKTEAAPEAKALAALPAEEYGFSVSDLDEELAAKFGVKLRSGVIITGVEEGSTAEAKNFETGDVVIRFNNKPVTSAKDFIAGLNALSPGQQWTVELATKENEDHSFIVLHDPRPASR